MITLWMYLRMAAALQCLATVATTLSFGSTAVFQLASCMCVFQARESLLVLPQRSTGQQNRRQLQYASAVRVAMM